MHQIEKIEQKVLGNAGFAMSDELTPWETLDREVVIDAYPWIEVWREKVQLPDGKIVPDYYMIRMPDVSAVVALTRQKEVVVLRQYKHGAGGTILGLPAGHVDPQEEPLMGAQRELLEETGFAAKEWVGLGSFVRNANRGSGSMHIFVALDAHQIAEPDSGDLEDAQIEFMSLDDLLVALQDGQVKVMGLALAILLAERYLKRHNLL